MNKQSRISRLFPAGTGLIIILALILALVAVAPAAAGGWATIQLDDSPAEIIAGEPWHLEFTVLQHNQTPVHMVFEGVPVQPIMTATHVETGESIRVEATAAVETGRFTLEATFPTAGMWEWNIAPDPLIGESSFKPLTVSTAPALTASAAANHGTPGVVAYLLVGLLAASGLSLLVGLFWMWNTRKPQPVMFDSQSTPH